MDRFLVLKGVGVGVQVPLALLAQTARVSR